MVPDANDFQDDYADPFGGVGDLSDAALEKLMSGGGAAAEEEDVTQLEPGTRVSGVVLEAQGDELLVELDGKNLGVIELSEFDALEVPAPGTPIQAEYLRFDDSKDACVLSTQTVRTEIAWEELRVGAVLSGRVTETNRGGLTLDIKGIRAFLPVSQIEIERVEDLEPYVGRTLSCAVIRFDRASEDLVVSRRQILEEEREAARASALESLEVGSVRSGTVRRLDDFGAFVDVGGVDGLLHISKIRQALGSADALHVGQKISVVIHNVDAARGRIGLDVHHAEEDAWDESIQGYAVGEVVTGVVSRQTEAGVFLRIDEGLEAVVRPDHIAELGDSASGSIVKGRIVAIDSAERTVQVRPLS